MSSCHFSATRLHRRRRRRVAGFHTHELRAYHCVAESELEYISGRQLPLTGKSWSAAHASHLRQKKKVFIKEPHCKSGAACAKRTYVLSSVLILLVG